MGSLDLWGAIAASLLLLQCIVFNLIFVALGLGLWKGSEWLHLNASRGLRFVARYLDMGAGYVTKGEQLVVGPFVRWRGRIVGARTAWRRLRG